MDTLRRFTVSCVALLLTLWAAPLPALDNSYSEVLRRVSLRTSLSFGDRETRNWVLGGAVTAVLLSLLAARLSRYLPQRPHPPRRASFAAAHAAAPPAARHTAWSFTRQAAALGLKLRESRNLRRIAARLSPADPEGLLATSSGRASLLADIDQRLRRRQREMELLQRLRDKLVRMNAEPLRERTSVRAEVDIPVSVLPRVHREDDESADEAMAADAPVAGRLVDVSEGGAALSTELSLATGDLVEIRPTRPQAYWPPLVAAVVGIGDGAEGVAPVVHLHFLEPPPPELKSLLVHLQRQAEEEVPVRRPA